MKLKTTQKAKEIFDRYDGNYYQMKRDEVFDEYKAFSISKDMEEQWMKERKEKIITKLLGSKNNKIIAETFELYGHYVVQTKCTSGLNLMLDFVLDRIKFWDTNTKYRSLKAVISSACVLKDDDEKKQVIKRCVMLLKEVANEEIKISDDYMENGVLPDYLCKETLHENIQRTIHFWLNQFNE